MYTAIRNTKAFTLVELVIVMTIIAFMSVTIISIYIHLIDVEKKLELTRLIQENAREITETIAKDVREYGVEYSWIKNMGWHIPWETNQYFGSGNEALYITGWQNRSYIFWKQTPSGLEPCTEQEKKAKNTSIRCSLFLVRNSDYIHAIDLIDPYRPNAWEKRVKIEDIRFYISWQPEIMEPKVTIVTTLMLTKKSGISWLFIDSTRTTLQTTISERAYKK